MGTRIEGIGSGDLEVEVLPELGARLHRLRAFGHDLLRTPPEMEAYAREPFFWGGYVMAPWCNRLPSEPIPFGEATIDLPANFADGTALHGQVQGLAWDVTAPGEFHVAGGGDGWPWSYEVTFSVRADGPGLRLALELRNLADEPMPSGVGIHPWFVRPLDVAVHAERVFRSNLDSSPWPEQVAREFDLRRLRPMPPELDATWTGLRQPEALRLRWPDAGIEAAARVSEAFEYLCAASPTSLGAAAIEPQTHGPDGLRRLLRGEIGGLRALGPGDSLAARLELDFSRWRV